MSPEVFQPAEQNNETPISYEFLDRSEEVRTSLKVEDAKDRWSGLMERVTKDIPKPDTQDRNQSLQDEIEKRYRAVSEKRAIVAKAFVAVTSVIDAKRELSDLQRKAVLRHFAEFLDMRQSYENILKGALPTGAQLPEYLAPYVVTKENVQFAIRAAEVLLPMQYDIKRSAGLSESPKTLAPLAYPIMMDAAKIQMKMGVVTKLLDGNNVPVQDPDQYAAMLAMLGYKNIDSRSIEAAKLFVGYLGKHMESIKGHADVSAKMKGNVEEMTVSEALECCVDLSGVGKIVSEISLRAPEILSKGIPDMRAFAKEIFENDDLYPERMVQLAMKPIADLGENPDEKKLEAYQNDVRAVMKFFLTGNAKFEAKRAPVKGRDRYVKTLSASQEKLVERLCKEVCSDKTLNKVLRSCFIPENKSERPFPDVQNKAEEKLRELIVGEEITLREAFELQYLTSSSSNSIAVAYKCVAILDSHGYTDIARELQFSIFKAITDMALADSDELPEMLNKYGLNENQQRELRNVREYLKESGIDVLDSWLSQFYLFVKYYPEIAWPLIVLNTTGVAVGAGILVSKGVRAIRLSGFETFAQMGPEAARAKYGIPKSVSLSRITKCQQEVRRLLSTYDRLSQRLHMPFAGSKQIKSMNMVLRSAKSGELADIAVALKRSYPHVNDLAAQLSQIASSESHLKKALTKAGYSTDEIGTAIKYLSDNNLPIGGGFGPEALSNAARAEERIAAFLENKSNKALMEQLSAKPKNSSLRLKAGRKVLGKRFLWPSQRTAIMKAHTLQTTNLAGKRAILLKVFRADEVRILMRSGVCGDVHVAMKNIASKTTGASNPFPRVGMNPDNLRVVGSRTAAEGSDLAGRTLTQAERSLVTRWLASPAFRRMLFAGGVALQGYILYTDILALEQAETFRKESRERIKADLDDMVKSGVFTKNGDTYSCGEIFSVRLKDLDANSQITTAQLRLMIDSISAGVFALGAAGVAAPPLWIIIGVECAAHSVVSAKQKNEYYTFVKHAKPWMLAFFGGTVGMQNVHEHHLISDTYSDAWLTAGSFVDFWEIITEKDMEMKQKLLFSWFMRQLGSNPSAFNEIVGTRTPEQIEKFYQEDFRKFILPAFMRNLYMYGYRSDVPYSQIKSLDAERVPSLLGSLVKPDLTKEDMSGALRRSMDTYILHKRERDFLEAKRIYDTATDPLQKELARQSLYVIGSKKVFGTRLLDVQDALANNNGKTRVELLMARFDETLAKAAGTGSWMDIMKNQFKANGTQFRDGAHKLVGTEKDPIGMTYTGKTSIEGTFSRGKNFYISTEGIHGLAGGKNEEFPNRLWFRDFAESRNYTPPVFKVDEAVPKIDHLYISPLFEGFHSAHVDLVQKRKELAGTQVRLTKVNRYIEMRSELESMRSYRTSILKKLDPLNKEYAAVIERRKASGFREFGAAKLKQLEKQMVAINEEAKPVYDNELRLQAQFDQWKSEAFGQLAIRKAYDGMSINELLQLFGRENGLYIQELQAAEEYTKQFLEEYEYMKGLSTTAGNLSAHQVETASHDPSITAALYPDPKKRPVITYSGDITIGSEEEKRHLQVFANYPYMVPTQSVYDLQHPSHLAGVHLHVRKNRNGDIEYQATYMYADRADDPNPDKDTVHYVQLGGVRRGGSGYLELGIAVSRAAFELPMPQDKKDVFFAAARNARIEAQMAKKSEILKKTSRADRLYRAGDIMNDLVQVSPNEWAVRFQKNGKNIFYLIRLKDGKFQSKRLEYTKKELGRRESALRWLKQEEAYRTTGSAETRQLTPGEREFGMKVQEDLALESWSTVPSELVQKFNLQADPSKFTHVVPLPPEYGNLGPGELGSVRDILVSKLGLLPKKPGEKGLEKTTYGSIEHIVDQLFISGKDAFAIAPLKGVFMTEFDRQVSQRSQEIRNATPARQQEIIRQILWNAARSADGNDISAPASRALQDAFQSEGWPSTPPPTTAPGGINPAG